MIKPSAIVSLNNLVLQKVSQGEKIFNLAAGDPALAPHPAIMRAVSERIAAQKSFPYPPVAGLPELRQLAAEWMNATSHARYTNKNVLVTCGGKFALYSTLCTLLQPGAEVLIPAPYWTSYPDIVSMAGGTPVIVPTTEWKISPSDLIKHATPRSSILILNSACNPTGVVYSQEELKALLAAAHSLNLKVVSDEVYSGLVYESSHYTSCSAFSEYEEDVIIIQSCSKHFAMTGWRVGFVFAPEKIIQALCAFHSQTITGTALCSQYAAIGALENAHVVNEYVKGVLKKRRDVMVGEFNRLFFQSIPAPQSALYLFLPMQALQASGSSTSFCEMLLQAHNVALVPGVVFGTEGYVRAAFTDTEPQLEQAVKVLAQALVEKK